MSTLNLMKFKGLQLDYKLGGFMLIGTVVGVEGGSADNGVVETFRPFLVLGRPVQYLDLVLSIFYVALLLWIGLVVYREARGASDGEGEAGFSPAEPTALTAKPQHLRLPPMISLPVSGIESISLWIIILVGVITGLLVGLLGVGGAFIRLPAFIYLIGCPMAVAIGTDFFENLFSMGYGTLTHSMKGNVDPLLVLVLLVTVVLGVKSASAWPAGSPRSILGGFRLYRLCRRSPDLRQTPVVVKSCIAILAQSPLPGVCHS